MLKVRMLFHLLVSAYTFYRLLDMVTDLIPENDDECLFYLGH